jgi:hypothetical protein
MFGPRARCCLGPVVVDVRDLIVDAPAPGPAIEISIASTRSSASATVNWAPGGRRRIRRAFYAAALARKHSRGVRRARSRPTT